MLAAFEMGGLLTNYFFAKAWGDTGPMVDEMARNCRYLSAKLKVSVPVNKMLRCRVKPQANEMVLEIELAKVLEAVERTQGSEVADTVRAANDIAVVVSRLESPWVDISPSGWRDLWARALVRFPTFLMGIGVDGTVIANTRKQVSALLNDVSLFPASRAYVQLLSASVHRIVVSGVIPPSVESFLAGCDVSDRKFDHDAREALSAVSQSR